MKRIKFFASILLMLCLSVVCCAQTKIDWKQIKNIPDTLEFKNVLLEHLLFKSAYQPVMESIHMGAIYYDNMLERLRVYEHGQWRDLSVSIASDSIGAPLTILGYLQASDIYASQSAYIGKDVNVKGNVNASGTSTFNYLKVNNALKVPTVASAALGVGSVYYDTSANKLKVLNSSNQWKVVSVDVDSALSTTSTNPVQNKAITAKINQTDADLINGMATTLQQSYNYANGIATQAYNYADSTASASKNYADLQISILNSTISEKLGSGTSDLYVKSIRTTNASITNRLDVRSLDIGLAFTVPSYYDPALLPTSDPRKASIYYNSANKYLGFAYLNPSNAVATKIIATEDNTVSNVATGTNNTIAVTKNGVTTNIAVGGEGKNPSSSTPPSNPTVGQIYFDINTNTLKYWNGTKWISVGATYSELVCVSYDMPIRLFNQGSAGSPGPVTVDYTESKGNTTFICRKITSDLVRITVRMSFTQNVLVPGGRVYGISLKDLHDNDFDTFLELSQVLDNITIVQPDSWYACLKHENNVFIYLPMANYYLTTDGYLAFGVYIPNNIPADLAYNTEIVLVADYFTN